jgi:hypothetical protein
VTDTAPHIGDTAPDGSVPEEHSPATRLREALERARARNAKLEHLPAEVASLKRQLGLARAGVDPDSTLGMVVATAAAADGIDDPDRVMDLARVLRHELNGGHGRGED